jgi:hypothetical protein
LFERGFEVFDDFLGEDIGLGGEIVGLFQAFVSEPEDVELGLSQFLTIRSFKLKPIRIFS